MHAVEDSEGQSDVDDRGPHGELVEVRLHAVVELGPGAEGRHDPELGREGGGGGGTQGGGTSVGPRLLTEQTKHEDLRPDGDVGWDRCDGPT